MNQIVTRSVAVIIAVTALVVSVGRAALIDLGNGPFSRGTAIRFDEKPLGTINPVYTGLNAGPLGLMDVSFAGSFVGQSIVVVGTQSPNFGGGPIKSLSGLPTGPLTLNAGAGSGITKTVPGVGTPVLSGDPQFEGPISILFSVPVSAVGIVCNFQDLGKTTFTAFAEDGSVLGSMANGVVGDHLYGLADSSGADVVKGISIYDTGLEFGGFDIKDLYLTAPPAIVTRAPDRGPSVVVLASVLGALVYAHRGRGQPGE